MKFGSRKFIVAVLLILMVLLLNIVILGAIPVAAFAAVVPSLIGMNTAVLSAVAIMYPAANTFESWKGKTDE